MHVVACEIHAGTASASCSWNSPLVWVSLQCFCVTFTFLGKVKKTEEGDTITANAKEKKCWSNHLTISTLLLKVGFVVIFHFQISYFRLRWRKARETYFLRWTQFLLCTQSDNFSNISLFCSLRRLTKTLHDFTILSIYFKGGCHCNSLKNYLSCVKCGRLYLISSYRFS